jgi:hypothetical protein
MEQKKACGWKSVYSLYFKGEILTVNCDYTVFEIPFVELKVLVEKISDLLIYRGIYTSTSSSIDSTNPST